jgi:hypothetical protein
VTFNWQALASAETAKISVSDGSDELLNTVVVDDGQIDDNEEIVPIIDEDEPNNDDTEGADLATEATTTGDNSTPATETIGDTDTVSDPADDTAVDPTIPTAENPTDQTPLADDLFNPSENIPAEPAIDMPAAESAPAETAPEEPVTPADSITGDPVASE